MKFIRKISALMISFLMALAMMVPVSAADATITIRNAGDGDTFDYVQIVEPDTTSKLGWKFVDSVKPYFVGDEKIATTEEDAIKKLIGKNYDASKMNTALEAIKADSSKTGTTITKVEGQTSPITVTKAGAYAVFGKNQSNKNIEYSPMVAYISFTYDGNANGLEGTTLTAKKSDHNVDKKHQSPKDDVVEVGQVVTYTVTAKVPFIREDEKNVSYKVVDKITGGEYVKNANGNVDVNVKIGDFEKTYEGTINKDEFSVDLSELVSNSNTYTNQTITITYKATVTKITVNNEVIIIGKTDTRTFTDSDKDSLKTAQIALTKTGDQGKALKDAKFVVYRFVGDKKQYIKFNENYEATGLATNLDDAKTQTIKTNENGKAIVKGLDSEYTYYFEEVVAPDGYTVLDKDVEATWDGKANVAITGEASATDTTVSSLPETGGMGTTIFTIGGCAIMVIAAALYFVNRKKQEK